MSLLHQLGLLITLLPMVHHFNTLLDSGCTRHVVRDRALFRDYAEMPESSSVGTATCGSLDALGHGDVEFRYPFGDRCIIFTLRGCLYAPAAPVNLLSVRVLMERGLSCLFSNGGITKVSYPDSHPNLPGLAFSPTVTNRLSYLLLDFIPPTASSAPVPFPPLVSPPVPGSVPIPSSLSSSHRSHRQPNFPLKGKPPFSNPHFLVIDSTLPSHIFNDRSLFTTYTPGRRVHRTAFGHDTIIEGTGEVNIRVFVAGQYFCFHMRNCWHIPSSLHHFLSCSTVISLGHQVMIAGRSPRLIYSPKRRLVDPTMPKYIPFTNVHGLLVLEFSIQSPILSQPRTQPTSSPETVISLQASTHFPFAGLSFDRNLFPAPEQVYIPPRVSSANGVHERHADSDAYVFSTTGIGVAHGGANTLMDVTARQSECHGFPLKEAVTLTVTLLGGADMGFHTMMSADATVDGIAKVVKEDYPIDDRRITTFSNSRSLATLDSTLCPHPFSPCTPYLPSILNSFPFHFPLSFSALTLSPYFVSLHLRVEFSSLSTIIVPFTITSSHLFPPFRIHGIPSEARSNSHDLPVCHAPNYSPCIEIPTSGLVPNHGTESQLTSHSHSPSSHTYYHQYQPWQHHAGTGPAVLELFPSKLHLGDHFQGSAALQRSDTTASSQRDDSDDVDSSRRFSMALGLKGDRRNGSGQKSKSTVTIKDRDSDPPFSYAVFRQTSAVHVIAVLKPFAYTRQLLPRREIRESLSTSSLPHVVSRECTPLIDILRASGFHLKYSPGHSLYFRVSFWVSTSILIQFNGFSGFSGSPVCCRNKLHGLSATLHPYVCILLLYFPLFSSFRVLVIFPFFPFSSFAFYFHPSLTFDSLFSWLSYVLSSFIFCSLPFTHYGGARFCPLFYLSLIRIHHLHPPDLLLTPPYPRLPDFRAVSHASYILVCTRPV